MDGFKRIGLGVLMSAALVFLVGCQCNDQLVTDNTRLKTQNKELQDALTQERNSRTACENERSSLMAEINRLQAMKSTAPVAAAPAPAPAEPAVGANTGFTSIEGVETEQRGGNIYVRIPGDVLFDSGKITLKTTAQKTLDQVAAVIKRDYPTKTIRVEGYTDTDPIRKSSWADNLELSLQRAAAVHRYLEKQGVSDKRMYAAGFGETHPRGTKAQSRRVEIVVVMND